MRRLVPVSLLVVLLAALIGACGGDDEGDGGGGGAATQDDLPTVRILALDGGMGGLAQYAMEENGFDEANGFKLEPFTGQAAATAQFLLQDEADVSFDGDLVTTAQLRLQGNDVTTFYPMVQQEATILTSPEAGVDDLADLVGKKVGVGGLDFSTHTILQMMLPTFYDVDAEAIDFQVTPEAAALRLIERGDLAAGVFGYPEILTGEIELGLTKLWGPAGKYWREEVGGGSWGITMMAKESWLEANPELARQVTAAYDDTVEWLEANSSQIPAEFFVENFGIEDDPEVRAAFDEALASGDILANEWTEADIESADRFLEEAARVGLIDEVPEGVTTRLTE